MGTLAPLRPGNDRSFARLKVDGQDRLQAAVEDKEPAGCGSDHAERIDEARPLAHCRRRHDRAVAALYVNAGDRVQPDVEDNKGAVSEACDRTRRRELRALAIVLSGEFGSVARPRLDPDDGAFAGVDHIV
jgi:hypothetical protein